MDNQKFYSVNEYFEVDLKRYLDEGGRENLLDSMIVKVIEKIRQIPIGCRVSSTKFFKDCYFAFVNVLFIST